jgi:hypothetical protein
MKYVITESQLKFLVEQPDSRFGLERFGYDPKKPQTLDKAMEKQEEFMSSLDPHTIMLIGSLASLAIPVVGPLISSGLMLADAGIYLKQGDTKTAGLVGLFSMIPLGGLATKLGLTNWSAKALAKIGEKISKGVKLSSAEAQVADKVVKNKQLIQNKIAELSKSKLGQSKVVKGTTQLAKPIAKTTAVDATYNKVYNAAQSNTPKAKAEKEGLEWEYVKLDFGSSGSEQDNNLLNQAWDKGWRPGKEVPKQFQTKEYQSRKV